MKISIASVVALLSLRLSSAFSPASPCSISQTITQRHIQVSSALSMATVSPSADSTVGIVGRGFVSVLTAKLAALAGYQSWVLLPPGQMDVVMSLLDDKPDNLELIESSDTETIDSKICETDALIVAVDDDSTMDEGVINYFLNPESATKVKRVVAMSRNLNGEGMGFLVKASKISANREVWDGGNANAYKKFENVIKRQAETMGIDYTIVRAGTLKGGACGEEQMFDQFLSSKFYEMTKKDVITWQLLFDCNVRGVKLAKGDVLPGPGGKAVFTATGTDAAPGDTSRSGIAEAMVKSLSFDQASNIDFGVGTVESRTPPTTDEWEKLFSALA